MTSRSLVAVLAPTATSHANTNPNEKRTTKDREPWGYATAITLMWTLLLIVGCVGL